MIRTLPMFKAPRLKSNPRTNLNLNFLHLYYIKILKVFQIFKALFFSGASTLNRTEIDCLQDSGFTLKLWKQMAHNSGKSYAPELSRIVEYYPRRCPLDGTGDGTGGWT